MWMQRKAINNCTFTNEHDIGKTVNDWTAENYNTTHGRRGEEAGLSTEWSCKDCLPAQSYSSEVFGSSGLSEGAAHTRY